MAEVNRIDDTECILCCDSQTVHIPLITCTHSSMFCEACVKKCIMAGYPFCSYCRANLPIRHYLETTGQASIPIANASLTMEYRQPSLPTTNRLVHKILIGCSIGVLIGLVIYPVLRRSN